MSRLRAATFALLVTLALFGLATAAAYWLFDARTIMDVLWASWFPVVVILFNSAVISLLVIVMIIRNRRAERAAEEEKSDLISASERLRQQLKRRG